MRLNLLCTEIVVQQQYGNMLEQQEGYLTKAMFTVKEWDFCIEQ